MTELEIGFGDTVFVFETAMRVRSTEVGMGQLLTIEALVAMLTEARMRFLHSKGINDVDHSDQSLMITNVVTRVYSRAREREALLFEVGAKNVTDTGGEFIFNVTRLLDGSQVARARMGFVAYDCLNNLEVPLSDTLYTALRHPPSTL